MCINEKTSVISYCLRRRFGANKTSLDVCFCAWAITSRSFPTGSEDDLSVSLRRFCLPESHVWKSSFHFRFPFSFGSFFVWIVIQMMDFVAPFLQRPLRNLRFFTQKWKRKDIEKQSLYLLSTIYIQYAGNSTSWVHHLLKHWCQSFKQFL